MGTFAVDVRTNAGDENEPLKLEFDDRQRNEGHSRRHALAQQEEGDQSAGYFAWGAFFAAVAASMMFGLAGIFAKLSGLNPLAVSFWRYCLATPVAGALLLAERLLPGLRPTTLPTPTPTPTATPLSTPAPAPTPNPTLVPPEAASEGAMSASPPFHRRTLVAAATAICVCGASNTLGNYTLNASLEHTTVIAASLLGNLEVVLVPLVVALHSKTRFGRPYLIGLTSCTLGLTLLCLSDHASSAGPSTPLRPAPKAYLGDALAILSSFFFTAYIISLQKVRQHLDSSHSLFAVNLSALVVATALAFFTSNFEAAHSVTTWLSLIGLGLFVGVLSTALLTYAVRHASPELFALTSGINPAVAAFLSWLLWKETLNLTQGFGALFLIVGLVVAQMTPQSWVRLLTPVRAAICRQKQKHFDKGDPATSDLELLVPQAPDRADGRD